MNDESAVLDPPAGVEDDGLGHGDEETPVTPPVEAPEEAPEAPETDDGPQEPPTPEAELPEDPQGDAGDQVEFEIALPGDRELGLKVGGRKPDSSVLKIKGGKIELGKSQFDRGDRFPTVFTLQVTGDNDQDTIVKETGEVKSTSKAQNATVCGTERLEDFLKMKLEGSPDLFEAVCRALDLEIPSE